MTELTLQSPVQTEVAAINDSATGVQLAGERISYGASAATGADHSYRMQTKLAANSIDLRIASSLPDLSLAGTEWSEAASRTPRIEIAPGAAMIDRCRYNPASLAGKDARSLKSICKSVVVDVTAAINPSQKGSCEGGCIRQQ